MFKDSHVVGGGEKKEAVKAWRHFMLKLHEFYSLYKIYGEIVQWSVILCDALELLEVPNVEHTEDSSNSGSSNKSRRKSWKMEKNTKAFYHSCINFVDPDEDRLGKYIYTISLYISFSSQKPKALPKWWLSFSSCCCYRFIVLHKSY